MCLSNLFKVKQPTMPEVQKIAPPPTVTTGDVGNAGDGEDQRRKKRRGFASTMLSQGTIAGAKDTLG